MLYRIFVYMFFF